MEKQEYEAIVGQLYLLVKDLQAQLAAAQAQLAEKPAVRQFTPGEALGASLHEVLKDGA